MVALFASHTEQGDRAGLWPCPVYFPRRGI